MRRHRILFLALATTSLGALAQACSSSVEDDGKGGDAQTATAGTGATKSTGAGNGDGGGGGIFVPPPDAKTVVFGPMDVEPGVEDTKCVVKRLGNVGAMHVNTMHNQLLGVSHHLIVYKTSDTEERLEPFSCQPFSDLTKPDKGLPLMITQKKDDTLELPQGVAFAIDDNQMVRLEMHYINATTQTATIEGRSTFVPMNEAEFRDEAGLFFAGNIDIDIAPNSQFTLGPAFIPAPPGIDGKNFFGFTGHVHRFGTSVTVDMVPGKDMPGEPVYAPPSFLWAEPPTIYHDPPKVPQQGGGFSLTCSYDNTSSDQIGFGESATEEMCFFWGYYYPSIGARVCFHTNQFGPITDLCCPGNALCSQI